MATHEKGAPNGDNRHDDAPLAIPVSDSDSFDGEIGDNDIVFDCPHCGHGLVINYKGAGLIINCAECSMPVQVPIPDGMELTDLDQEPEELQSQIRNLRRALYRAEERGRELENVVNGLKERRTALEKERAAQMHRLAEVRSALEPVQRMNSDIAAACNRILDIIQAETR